MSEEVQPHKNRENPDNQSQFLSISVRGWLAWMLITTVCLHSAASLTVGVILALRSGSITEMKVTEPLYTMAGMALAYYFGQQTKKQ